MYSKDPVKADAKIRKVDPNLADKVKASMGSVNGRAHSGSDNVKGNGVTKATASTNILQESNYLNRSVSSDVDLAEDDVDKAIGAISGISSSVAKGTGTGILILASFIVVCAIVLRIDNKYTRKCLAYFVGVASGHNSGKMPKIVAVIWKAFCKLICALAGQKAVAKAKADIGADSELEERLSISRDLLMDWAA